MKLQEEHIKDKKIVGHTSDGRPVVMVETHGGLFAFFTKSKEGSSIETLAAAPHRAIGAFMCEQKDKIKWNKKLEDTAKSEADSLFSGLRERLFSSEIGLAKSDNQYYIYYDHLYGTFELLHGDDIPKLLEKGEIDPFGFIRKSDFSEPLMFARDKNG